MAQPFKIEPTAWSAGAKAPAVSSLRYAEAGSDHRQLETSPALLLQERLADEWRKSEPTPWSPRQTLAFILLSNGLFWLALGWGLRAIA